MNLGEIVVKKRLEKELGSHRIGPGNDWILPQMGWEIIGVF